MSRNDNDRTPEGSDPVVRRLREERPQLEALELDRMKTRLMNRRGSQTMKGAGLRGRIVIALLSLGLLAGGVAAAGSSGGAGASSASAQYKPPTKCVKPYYFSHKKHKCVATKAPKCPHGSHFAKKSNACVANKKPHKQSPPRCSKGYHYNKKFHKCQATKPTHLHCPKGYHFVRHNGKLLCYNPRTHSTIRPVRSSSSK